METEEKTTMTDTIKINNNNYESHIFVLKKYPKNNLKTLKRNFLNNKNSHTERNENLEKKYRIFETQITPKKHNNLIAKKKLKIISRNSNDKRLLLLNEIKHICHNIYDTKKGKNNNFKLKLREDIIKNINNFVFSDLRKNVLFPKMLTLKNNSRINIRKLKFFSEEKKKIKKAGENAMKKDLDKLSMKDILNKYDENYKLKNRNIKVYRFNYGDYAKNDTKYNHPQILTLLFWNLFHFK